MSTTWMTRTGMIGLAFTLMTSTGTATEAGDITVDLRLRVEAAEIDGTEDADNTTSRLRLGYLSPDFKGFKFGAEGNSRLHSRAMPITLLAYTGIQTRPSSPTRNPMISTSCSWHTCSTTPCSRWAAR